MKKCRSCQKEIDPKASKCPYCQSKQGNWAQRHPILTGIIVIIVIFIAIGASGGSKSPSTQSASPSPTTEAVQQGDNIQATSTPTTGTTKTTAPAEETSSETVAQKNAVRKASSYLSFSGFSRSGLIKQLEFDKFSTEDATYAVDKVGADWNEQAAKKAKSYQDISPFSRDGLIKQLEFDGFTTAQATHGADSVGL